MNGGRIRANASIRDVAPGLSTFAYEVPDLERTYHAELELAPGNRYGLFINLHSPFDWHLTGLGDFNRHPPARSKIVRLPDGRWLAAYCAQNSKIMLSISNDLATWETPWPFALNSVFDNIAPALLVDESGTIWLAYFSNRLHLEITSSAGYRLWLTSSPDGRTWSRPRPVAGGGPHGGWPMGNIQLTRDMHGKYWLFWRRYAAAGNAPGGIGTLREIDMELPPRVNLSNPHVSVGHDGFHMVFDDFGNGIYYSRSSDGRHWTPPVLTVPLGRHSKVSHGQLIRAGNRIALVYEGLNGAWLRRGTLAATPELGPELKITNYLTPLNGARLHVAPTGEAGLLAGLDHVWFLRTTLPELIGSPGKP